MKCQRWTLKLRVLGYYFENMIQQTQSNRKIASKLIIIILILLILDIHWTVAQFRIRPRSVTVLIYAFKFLCNAYPQFITREARMEWQFSTVINGINIIYIAKL